MKTLKKIKLNGLNDAELRDREMNALNGGRACSCSCSAPGGSADGANGSANYKLGTSGGHSFPVLLLYASLTSLETVFKVLLIIGNT